MRAEREGALTDKDKDAMRAVKFQLLPLDPAEAPIELVAQAPFDEFMAEWQVTAERVHAEFTRNSVQPSDETFQAACWLEFQFNEPWITILGRISKAAAKRFFQEIVRGTCSARFDDHARVVIRRNAPRVGRGG